MIIVALAETLKVFQFSHLIVRILVRVRSNNNRSLETRRETGMLCLFWTGLFLFSFFFLSYF